MGQPADESVEEHIRREYEAGATYQQLAKKYRKSFTQISEAPPSGGEAKGQKAGRRSRRKAFGLRKKISIMERKLSDIDAFVKELRSTLEALHQTHIHPEVGCIHIGEYGDAECLFNNPSKLLCALCPHYVPKWLPSLVTKKAKGLRLLNHIRLPTLQRAYSEPARAVSARLVGR